MVTGICAISAFILFIVVIILYSSFGLGEIEEGSVGQQVMSINEYRSIILTVLWLTLAGMILAVSIALGLYQALREAGALLWAAAAAWVAGTLFQIVFVILNIGLAWELALGYMEASDAGKLILDVVSSILMRYGYLSYLLGSLLSWGIGLALFALAILRTAVVPRWIGWLGLVPALIGGWLPLLDPLSDVYGSIGLLGFFIFLIWLVIMGFTIVRLREAPAAPA